MTVIRATGFRHIIRFFNRSSNFSCFILIIHVSILFFSFTFGSKSGNSESPSTVKTVVKKLYQISALSSSSVLISPFSNTSFTFSFLFHMAPK